MLLKGEVKGIKGDCVWCAVPVSPVELEKLKEHHSATVTVEFEDSRMISRQQQRKVYVLIRYISEALGYTPVEVIKEMTKLLFVSTGITCKTDMFSLADVDRTTAREYIDFLIQFCIENGIECHEPLYKLCEDLERYTYYCLMNKVCCVCGSPKCDLHHVDSVGQGRNRKDIIHLGYSCLPLCRKCHNTAHSQGKETFLKKYAVVPIPINEEIGKRYKLKIK